MGMSSSQARLLNLTARMHQLEFKAAKLEDQKLQLANESDRVYQDYLLALDARKIQYRTLMRDGTITFRDANMNIMQNGVVPTYASEKSREILFLQANDGRIMVTPTVATYYHLSETSPVDPDMNNYVQTVTGETMTPIPVNRIDYVPDPSVITGFTPQPNRVVSTASNSHGGFTPVENAVGGIDYEALASYASFDNSSVTIPATAQEITPATTSISPSTTYTIKSADDLKKLADLSATNSTSGVKIVLDADIDMSSITGWSGIKNFAGEFDGNGHVISNLTGTQGLFDKTQDATIKNVGLENINISGSNTYTGGLIGYANTTNISNCYTTGSVKSTTTSTISSFTSSTFSTGTGGLVGYSHTPGGKTAVWNGIYSSATVEGNDGVGGLVGTMSVLYANGKFDILNAYAIGDVTGRNGVGGFIGAAYNDEDNSSDTTDIRNCYSGGTVKGTDKVGGFVGSYLYWGDNNDKCEINGCNTTATVISGGEKGAFAGHIWVKMASANASNVQVNYLVNFVDCGYASGGLPGYGNITDENGNLSADVGGTNWNISDLVQSTGAGSGLVEYNLAGTIPSIEADGSGAYMSNILGVLTKAEVFDACDHSTENVALMKSKIAAFLGKFSNNNTDNAKLWYLNNAMVDYLNSGSPTDLTLASKLLADINACSTTNTASYQTGPALSGSVKRGAGAAWTPAGVHNPGVLETPSIDTIAESIYYALKVADPTFSKSMSDVKSWFHSKYGALTHADTVTLANINEMINNGGNLNALYNAVRSNGNRVDYTAKWSDPHDWTINVSPTYTPVEYSTGTSPVEVFDHYDYEWDTTNPDIANAIMMWAIAQRGIIIVDESLASSGDYLTNMLANAEAVFTKFDPSKVSDLAAMTPAEIMALTDEEYNTKMGIKNVSVATETAVQEVIDKQYIREAESKYEADMARIDKKDAHYDTELSYIKTERDATAQAMETLKRVAHENVDRVFKLFS